MVPTNVQWENERVASGITNSSTLFTNRLKLPTSGIRSNTTGLFNDLGNKSFYWTTTIRPATNYGIYVMNTSSSGANTTLYVSKAVALPCRCILKN